MLVAYVCHLLSMYVSLYSVVDCCCVFGVFIVVYVLMYLCVVVCLVIVFVYYMCLLHCCCYVVCEFMCLFQLFSCSNMSLFSCVIDVFMCLVCVCSSLLDLCL